jgi:hypothetical protein
MPPVIQSNDIQAKLPKSFFFRTISCNKRFGYRRNRSLSKMESRNRTDNLHLPANMQPRHKVLLPDEFFLTVDAKEKAIGAPELLRGGLKFDDVLSDAICA